MKKKLYVKFMIVAAIAIMVTAVCSLLLFYNILKEQIFDDLKANAHVIERLALPELKSDINREEIRITVIEGNGASCGNVLYDSMEDEEIMGNHQDRPEVLEAMDYGEGRDIRKSVTSSRHTFYYALKMQNGNILRVGKNSDSVYHLIRNMVGMAIVISFCVFLLCLLFSHHVTKRLIAPIEKMADNIVVADEQNVYEEMRPFIAMIKKQHVDILNHAQMRQEFTANVSHELKTPLTAISGYAELIENGMTKGEDTEHFANEIRRNAERLLTLINDIIELSELDSNGKKIEFETLDLYELGKNCVSAMEFTAQNSEVMLHLEGEHVPVNGNKTLLDELFYNLCSNAVRYNKKGGDVTILITTENGRPVLSVKDTGIGIPKNQQDRVFERFYRVDKSRSKSTGGTGLGLAIVKHIVVQHDAQIFLTSEEGVGTEIKVIF